MIDLHERHSKVYTGNLGICLTCKKAIHRKNCHNSWQTFNNPTVEDFGKWIADLEKRIEGMKELLQIINECTREKVKFS
jgi:hypothetical protein